ncbi:MAG: glycosyltransferase family 4 protein [Bacteroidetes bacterium]|nr:glycosyltransferase family 4 protein [Bacteroidota bacterium]
MIRMIFKTILVYFSLILIRKKEKSCLIIADFGVYGGTKTYFISLLDYLSVNGYNITALLSTKQIDEEIKTLQLKFRFEIELLDFDIWRTHFKAPIRNKLNKQFLLYQLNELQYFWKIIRRLKFSHLIISTGNPEWLLFLIMSPCKVFYILHTSTMDKLDAFKRLVINFFLCKKKQIIVVSNSAKLLILKNWTIQKNDSFIKVIYNYFEPSDVITAKVNNSIPTLLTIGSTEYYKNPLFWFEVCKKVLTIYNEPINFIWAGEGSQYNQCLLLADKYPQIKFIGYVKDVDRLYQNCTIYFQPSILESHGISVLGAMYHSKPCVVSNKGGLVESVIDDLTGFIVQIDSITASVNAIMSILSNLDKGESMGRNGKTRCNSTFTKELWIEKMNQIFQ